MFISLFLRSVAVIASIVLGAEAIYAIVFAIKGHKNRFIDDKED